MLSKAAARETVGDPDYQFGGFAFKVINLISRYFRVEISGLEKIPRSPAVLVGNHNSGLTFIDPMFVGVAWYNRTGGGDEFVYLVHDAMLATPLLGGFLRKMGAAKACRRVADQSLKMGRKVMIYPGGNYEAFRPYKDRFKVDFGGKKGFIRLALRHKVPIVPIVGVGAHESFYVLWRGDKLVRRTGLGKLFRVESFPIGFGLPWGIFAGPIFHFPLPAKIQIEVGETLSLDAYGDDAIDDEEVLEEIYQRVIAEMQGIMDRVSSTRRLPILG